MLSKDSLREAGIKYRQCLWKWYDPKHKLKTCEFSDDWDYMSMDYATYLSLWASRFNKDYLPNDDRFLIITHKRNNNWLITLVEMLREDYATQNTAL